MTFRRQEFVSPGTWTWPGTVDTVQVTVVGGGGGSCTLSPSISAGPGGGGGGAVVTKWVPVSGPVPITIGAGGTGNDSYPLTTSGGTSYFGSAGPGPIPAIPTSTVAAGGGARSDDSIPSPLYPLGGGGGSMSNISPTAFSRQGGLLGTNGVRYNGGAGGRNAIMIRQPDQPSGYGISIGEDYYGNGGSAQSGLGLAMWGSPAPSSVWGSPPAFINNTGAGGTSGPNPSGAPQSSPGSSGIVIVRWFE